MTSALQWVPRQPSTHHCRSTGPTVTIVLSHRILIRIGPIRVGRVSAIGFVPQKLKLKKSKSKAALSWKTLILRFSSNYSSYFCRVGSFSKKCIELSFVSAIFSLFLVRMVEARLGRWLNLVLFMLILLKGEGFNVDITYVQSAIAKGAVCLDGSPPAYHFSPGFGSGINNWLLQIEGGGWCNNVATCLARKTTRLGSSKAMVTQLAFSGILSNNKKSNPDFYDWNKVKVRYCDGSSFTGDVEAVDPATNLHFRGARVWLAIVEDLLAKGMKNAKNAILSGCSAGGLTSILHCDNFRSLLPSATVKCLADAGFFINAKDVSGALRIESFYSDVVETHNSAKNLPASCTSKLRPGLCFFPQNVAPTIRTPLFLVNAAFDSWQIKNILAPGVADPHGLWHDCKLDIKSCSSSQLKTMQAYRLEFLDAIKGVSSSPSNGMFIDSCYAHCQTGMQETWLRVDSTVLNNTTIGKAVGDWFFGRNTFRSIDCAYPCNPTCHNRIFES